jgi:hypothetical protein
MRSNSTASRVPFWSRRQPAQPDPRRWHFERAIMDKNKILADAFWRLVGYLESSDVPKEVHDYALARARDVVIAFGYEQKGKEQHGDR